MSVRGDHDGGAAKRRRDSRLRMHWRHEELALQMAVAAALHHSRDVGPVTYNALRSHKNSVAGALFEELSGVRPEVVAAPRPQDRVKRHTVEHIIDVPNVQILDALVPKMVDHVMDAFRRLDRPIAEQAGCRSAQDLVLILSFPGGLREPQMVEQLPEVPTILHFSSRPLTLQFLVVVVLEVHKVFSHVRVRRLLWSRSFKLQLVVEFLEVFKVFLQDMVR